MIAVVAQPRVSVSGATVKRPIWSRLLPHHGCHNGYSHKTVDDGAPKQGFDGIERGKVNSNSEDCGDDYAVKADRLPRLVLEATFPALQLSEHVCR